MARKFSLEFWILLSGGLVNVAAFFAILYAYFQGVFSSDILFAFIVFIIIVNVVPISATLDLFPYFLKPFKKIFNKLKRKNPPN